MEEGPTSPLLNSDSVKSAANQKSGLSSVFPGLDEARLMLDSWFEVVLQLDDIESAKLAAQDATSKDSEPVRNTTSGKPRLHSGEVAFRCKICNAKFSRSAVLKNHLLVHKTERLYGCATCGKVYGNWLDFQCHQLSHEVVKEGRLKQECTICERVFLSVDLMRRHKQRVHKTVTPEGVKTTKRSGEKVFAPDHLSNDQQQVDKISVATEPLTSSEKRVTTTKEQEILNVVEEPCLNVIEEPIMNVIEETSMNVVKESSLNTIENPSAMVPSDIMYDDNDDDNADTLLTVDCDVETTQTSNERHQVEHKCKYCGVLFNQEEDLKWHESSCTREAAKSKKKKIRTCQICKRDFKNSSSLSKHKRNKHGNPKRHECPVCGKLFVALDACKSHMAVHSNERNFRCEKCGKTFKHKSTLSSHLSSHVDDYPHKCTSCDMSFVTRRELQKHGAEHEGKEEHTCTECGERFFNYYLLKQHKLKHGIKSGTPCICEICGKSYGEEHTLKVHMRVHTGQGLHKCEVCSQEFLQKHSLDVHMLKHTGERPYLCFICGKGFYTKNCCKNHMNIHNDQPSFSCTTCGKKFKQKAALVHHVRLHRSEATFGCSDCGLAFRTRYRLLQHRREHTGDRGHQCTECGKEFTSPQGLQKHYLTHTGERPFPCEICGKAFSTKSVLKEHLQRHNGERPYACEVCQKSFVSHSNLRTHQTTHLAVKPFSCDVCGKSFGEKYRLKLHMAAHDDQIEFRCMICAKEFACQSNVTRHLRDVHKIVEPKELMSNIM